MENLVIILVPIYKQHLDVYERTSLEQLRNVLGDYEIRWVAPESLVIDYGELSSGLFAERFSDRYFQSKTSYSELLMSEDFYERFLNYKYLLIYQLDAFVFADRLSEFCQMGYDYIGAPVTRNTSAWHPIGKRIGNGGLSLRNVRSCMRVCRQKESVFAKRPVEWETNEFLLWEDLFFAFCGNRKEMAFRIPSYRVAFEFAVGDDMGHIFKQLEGGWRPFGCHGWPNVNYAQWKPIIESFGYRLPKGRGSQLVSSRRIRFQKKCILHILRDQKAQKCLQVLSSFMSARFQEKPLAHECSIWGWGEHGKLCFAFLQAVDIDVLRIFDRKREVASAPCTVLTPTEENIRNEDRPIFVATTEYGEEIAQQLIDWGRVRNRDFFLWADVIDEIVHRVVRDITKHFTFEEL